MCGGQVAKLRDGTTTNGPDSGHAWPEMIFDAMRGTLSCLCSALPERCPSIFNDVVCAGFGCYSNESIRAELVP
eukprot:CAMPEP_0119500136 /NCGR_PEP_ID=MMETSP1344-20130328/22365_1 /TAXON_ID=236787 /ORGANISM="Florenciella parvula, Strain CCMP2471" /LENGTH=73 /DNA_ID=CAMNT_0007536191 /DNA_START=1 /DNA_END=219 /DNA_ORIENTATION=+